MGHIVNIAFQGGTHGNYLRFIIDKFSRLTEKLEGSPFTEIGTSHNELKYSNKINRYHPNKNYPYFINVDDPHILITVDKSDILFLERFVTIRAGDFKINTNSDIIKMNSNFLEKFQWGEDLKKYYNLDITKDYNLNRFVLRDFYKLTFLDPDKNGFIIVDKNLRDNKPKNTFCFPISSFWDKDRFFNTLEDVNKKFNLKIEVDNKKIHDEFLNNLKFLDTKHRADKVINYIQKNQNVEISDLDTVEQAYISAWIEKNYNFVQTPLCNSFFKSTGEIIQWLENYPNHYKAMNPNLPMFNGIPNPFHLWSLKK